MTATARRSQFTAVDAEVQTKQSAVRERTGFHTLAE